jgi:hypothetical protein
MRLYTLTVGGVKQAVKTNPGPTRFSHPQSLENKNNHVLLQIVKNHCSIHAGSLVKVHNEVATLFVP